MPALLILLAVAAVVPFAVALNGYVFASLWGWFLVPLGLPTMTWAHAAGIFCMITLVRPIKPDAKEMKPASALGAAIGAPLLSWGIGAVIHWAML